MKTNFENLFLSKMSMAEKEFSDAMKVFYEAEEKYCLSMKQFIQKHITNKQDSFSKLYKEHKLFEADYVCGESYDFVKEYRIYDAIIYFHIAKIESGRVSDIALSSNQEVCNEQ